MNTRLLALGGAVLLLAGCGTAAHPRVRGTPTTPSPASTPTGSPSTGPSPTPSAIASACTAGQVSGRFGGSQPLTGSTLLATFLFSDTSATSCTLQGTPSIQLLTSSGGQIQLSLGKYQGPATGGGPVTLEPGVSAPTSRQPGVAELEVTWDSSAGGAPSCPGSAAEAARAIFSVNGAQVSVPITVQGPGQQLAPCEGQIAVGSFSSTS